MMETNNHIPTYVSALSLVIKYSSLKYVEILLTEHSWGRSITMLTKFWPLLTTYLDISEGITVLRVDLHTVDISSMYTA